MSAPIDAGVQSRGVEGLIATVEVGVDDVALVGWAGADWDGADGGGGDGAGADWGGGGFVAGGLFVGGSVLGDVGQGVDGAVGQGGGVVGATVVVEVAVEVAVVGTVVATVETVGAVGIRGTVSSLWLASRELPQAAPTTARATSASVIARREPRRSPAISGGPGG